MKPPFASPFPVSLLAALVGLVALLTAGSRPAEARPDPLGDRKKPTLKAPAPPPAAKPAGGTAAEKEHGAKTATVTPDTVAAAAPEAGAERPTAGATTGAAGAAATGRPALGAQDGSYKLGPRDALKIEVWNRAEIEFEWRPVTVTDDGTVYLPLLEHVKVGGLTVTEAITKLTKLYDAYIIEPQVFLQIAEYNSRLVNVTGEVKSPGRYPLKGELTLTELLAEAGDLSKDASKTVRLIRPRPGDAAPEVRDIDLDRIATGDPRGNIKIQPGDEISVLPNKNIVYVTGAVKTEGYVEYEDGMTAQQAIILAGGLGEGHAGGRTKVFRVENGKTREYKVNVKDQKAPFVLQPGDIIKVPFSII